MKNSIKSQHIKRLKTQPTSDGDGVKIQRIAGFNDPDFSPFLMIDELKSDDRADYVGGFPPHPHRGIETLTYMLEGHFQHRDHMGNQGELRSGGAQWMAAGRGVIHSEMPIMDKGRLHGFQIWINQPATEKMSPAQYQDFQPETIAKYDLYGLGVARIIAGNLIIDDKVVSGPLQESSADISVLDIRAEKALDTQLLLKQEYQVLVYVYLGEAKINGEVFQAGEMAKVQARLLSRVSLSENSGLLVLAGSPIHEPVVHYGPFVMNSEQEIMQAIQDYNSGLFESY